ncbi:MAG: rRNA maturation RNase YbeY [Candidatus Aureabacteria bacterium]|nr:rRNA maturation RNase YbeY [Candidatus Auribacterota bacterium]
MPRVEIRNEQRLVALDRRAIRDLVGFVLREEDAPSGEVSLLFTDNGGIQNLNRRWLKRDYPTDVMAFPQEHRRGEDSSRFLGDVAVSMERVREQAGAEKELALCIVHGLLHLFGHADHPLRRRREMARRERALARRWKREAAWSLIKS